MKDYTIYLDTIARVKSFVHLVNLHTGDFDLIHGRYVVDAKSIMGIFSLDLEEPLTLRVHGDVSANLDAALGEYLTPTSAQIG